MLIQLVFSTDVLRWWIQVDERYMFDLFPLICFVEVDRVSDTQDEGHGI